MDVTTRMKSSKLGVFFFFLPPIAGPGGQLQKIGRGRESWQICLSLIDCSLFRQREGCHSWPAGGF